MRSSEPLNLSEAFALQRSSSSNDKGKVEAYHAKLNVSFKFEGS